MSRLVPDQQAQRTNSRSDGETADRARLNAEEVPPTKEKLEDYLERVAKYVPVEIVAAFVTIRGLAPVHGTEAAWPAGLEIAVFVALVAATAGYLIKFGGSVPRKRLQIVISMVSFVIWSYGIGGPFFWGTLEAVTSTHLVYQGFAGALVIVWSLAIGLHNPSKQS